MKISMTKEWCTRMAHLEEGVDINAGMVAADPVFDGEPVLAPIPADGQNVAFGRFVRLMRRDRRMTLEKLADGASVSIKELVEIEDGVGHKPEPRTVYQLANFFKVPRPRLLEIAGLAVPKDQRLLDEAVRFAARSDPVAELTQEERRALETFVAVLSEK